LRQSVRLNIFSAGTFAPSPAFNYFFKACHKGDATAKAATVGESAVRVLADASDITGLLGANAQLEMVWESSAVEIRTGEEKLERRTLPRNDLDIY
jgi:hypothetical protein